MTIHATAPLRDRPAFKALEEHCGKVCKLHFRQLFAEDPERSEHFTLQALGLYFDYSKNRITGEEVRADGTPEWLVPHRTFEGNRPSNTILAERIIPELVGVADKPLKHDSSTNALIRHYGSLKH